MSLEREVEHTVSVTNLAMAMMRAQNYDRTNCACGVAIMASVLAGQDRDARTMLAHQMLKLARELDPDLVNARWQ
jgi:hypothetical protein